MIEKCKNCKALSNKGNASACRNVQCGLSLLLIGQERIKRRYLSRLQENLPDDVLYHCFTGESDEEELKKFLKLNHVLRSSLLDRAFKLWPERLQQIANRLATETIDSQKIVNSFVKDRLK